MVLGAPQALDKFDATDPTELALKKGDLIDVVSVYNVVCSVVCSVVRCGMVRCDGVCGVVWCGVA